MPRGRAGLKWEARASGRLTATSTSSTSRLPQVNSRCTRSPPLPGRSPIRVSIATSPMAMARSSQGMDGQPLGRKETA